VDRTAIVTKDAETKVSQPSNMHELINMESCKHCLNYHMLKIICCARCLLSVRTYS
jgi:hypothetical protein